VGTDEAAQSAVTVDEGLAALRCTGVPIYDSGSDHISKIRVYEAVKLVGGDVPTACSAVTFTDNPIVPGITTVKKAHLTELRNGIDAARIRNGLSAYTSWSTVTVGFTEIQKSHIDHLRKALNQAYDIANKTRPTYTDSQGVDAELPSGTAIKAVHIREIRLALCRAPWQS
jgi:hypothetical protein